ncbi:MAG: aminoacyl-tRNA hydrolase [Paenibacillaceae bacterium]|nr:aminoacyl-tRNA hydrolase [Paenibacillaceae bacterium]
MRWIVGLGNPGDAYARTRHNFGWMALDALAAQSFAVWKEAKAHRGTIAYTTIEGVDVMLIKPLTYMNASGQCVASLLRAHRWDIADGLVLVDDMDTPLGRVRLRAQGGHGGHNGLRSLIAMLQTNAFARVRMGISRPPEEQLFADYVLERFRPDEHRMCTQTIERACAAVRCVLTMPMEQAMTRVNDYVLGE